MTRPYRITSSGSPVATIRATDREEALRVFTDGRGLPAGIDLAAYSVTALETKRPRAAKRPRA